MSYADLIKEAMILKKEMEEKKQRLAEIAGIIDQNANFKENCATGHIYDGQYHAKIVRKNVVKWNQKKLEETRKVFIGNDFFKIFEWEFKPKKELKEYMKYGNEENVKMLKECFEIKQASPTVTYEYCENEKICENE